MKIGIMSFAHHHAEAYIHNLAAIPGVDLMGVADEQSQRGRKFAQQFNTTFYNSYQDL
jgi:UDP-N-acetylglucosamine 3-dehydrogenase